jgi:hypothetical protein
MSLPLMQMLPAALKMFELTRKEVCRRGVGWDRRCCVSIYVKLCLSKLGAKAYVRVTSLSPGGSLALCPLSMCVYISMCVTWFLSLGGSRAMSPRLGGQRRV